MNGYEVIECEKPNDTDESKVVKLMDSIKCNGWKGIPILVMGNIALTGSHRIEALRRLAEEDFNIDFECATDVSDLVSDMDQEELFNNLDSLRYVFAGTWVEDYKDELEEW